MPPAGDTPTPPNTDDDTLRQAAALNARWEFLKQQNLIVMGNTRQLKTQLMMAITAGELDAEVLAHLRREFVDMANACGVEGA